MSFRIVLTPKAGRHLNSIYDYIAREASPGIAQRFTDTIVDHIGKLSDYPRRGSPRDDLRPCTRTITFRRRVTITYVVEDAAVVILGLYYGGQDFETLVREDQSG